MTDPDDGWSARVWSAWRDDRTSGECLYLDSRRCDGPATRVGGLTALVQTTLEQDPYAGHVFVFRGRRRDLIRLPWWDGDELCLFAQGAGTRTIRLAQDGHRHRCTHAGTVIELWHSSNMAAVTAPDLSALDIDALRAMVLGQNAVIEPLQTTIAHLRRMQFGRKSEKIVRQVEQLELELDELESAKATRLEGCPACGSELNKLGEDVSEVLEWVPASLK